MASELIEKIKVFLFFDPKFRGLRIRESRLANPRDVAPGAVIGAWGCRMGVGEWIPGNT